MHAAFLAFAVAGGMLGVMAALIAGLPAPLVALSYMISGSFGLLSAAVLRAATVCAAETAGDPPWRST